MSTSLFSALNYQGANGRGLSPKLWRRLKTLVRRGNVSHGRFYFDDFDTFVGTVGSNVGTYVGRYGYRSFEDTGCSLAQVATERDGVIRFTTDTTDNDEVNLKLGGANSVQCMISDDQAARRLVFYETRLRTNSIANTIAGIFAGLTEEGLAVTDGILADGGTLQDKDLVGFVRLEGDGDRFDTVYNKASAGGVTTLKADAIELVADTWIKVGLLYEFDHQDGARVTMFADGEPLADAISARPFGSGFPDGEELSPLWALKNATTTGAQLDLDWFGLAEVLL